MSMRSMGTFAAFLVFAALIAVEADAAVEEKSDSKNSLVGEDFNKQPTFIKSDTLAVKSDQRTFVYEGNVEVKHGDMTLTSSTLDGKYSDQNEVEQLVAKGNVLIVKGDGIRATGERAVYEAATSIVTLTDNPELQQNGSVLTADNIKIYLKEDRSQAEGNVRVKLVQKENEEGSPTGKSLLTLNEN